MTIRPATLADLDAIADIAQDQRIRQEGWQGDLWPLAAAARELHPAELREAVEDGATATLVAAPDHRVDGYVIAGPVGRSAADARTWVVAEIGVSRPRKWDTVGRVLLAALGGRACVAGVERVVVGCPTLDHPRRAALAAAGLELDCWFRHLVLDGAPHVGDRPPAGGEPGLPLPHLHGLLPSVGAAVSVATPGAHALLTPSLRPSSTIADQRPYALADPVIGNDDGALWTSIETLERTCRERGDGTLLVAVGPGEEPLDELLDGRGYGRPIEWWTFRPKP